MSERTSDRATPSIGVRALIPEALLLAAESFGGELSAARVTGALARGLREGGCVELDECPLPRPRRREPAAAVLDAVHFDSRMRRARAVIVAARELRERTLPGSLAFEVATRARQGGVPAYAVTACDSLGAFDARLLDLQVVLEAGDERELVAAGRKLASLV